MDKITWKMGQEKVEGVLELSCVRSECQISQLLEAPYVTTVTGPRLPIPQTLLAGSRDLMAV